MHLDEVNSVYGLFFLHDAAEDQDAAGRDIELEPTFVIGLIERVRLRVIEFVLPDLDVAEAAVALVVAVQDKLVRGIAAKEAIIGIGPAAIEVEDE